MKFVVLLFALLAVSYAQVPKPCLDPKLFESRIFEFNPDQKEEVRARFSYDAINHRVRIIDEVILGTTKTYNDILFLYNVGMQYVYNFNNRTCQRTALTRPWRDFGIPDDATNFGEGYVGASTVFNGVLVTLWGGNTTDGGRYFGAWTYDACIPVEHSYFSTTRGLYTTNFFDTTLGIADPNVFIPPSQCLTD